MHSGILQLTCLPKHWRLYIHKVKFGIGPPIENGFYYDVDLGDRPFGDEELAAVEKKMLELAKTNNAFVRSDVSKKEAIEYFTKKAMNINLN